MVCTRKLNHANMGLDAQKFSCAKISTFTVGAFVCQSEYNLKPGVVGTSHHQVASVESDTSCYFIYIL